MTKNGEKSQENVKCLNFPYFAILGQKSHSYAPKKCIQIEHVTHFRGC